MEKMFKWTANAHNLRFVSLRYFNACGAHPNGRIGEAHNPETHLIPLILQVRMERESIFPFLEMIMIRKMVLVSETIFM